MQKFLSKDLFTNMYVFFKSKELVKQVCELLKKFHLVCNQLRRVVIYPLEYN